MNDLISRQDAIDAFWKLDVEIRPSAIDAITNMLMSLPSARPDRKRGKWIKISPANIYECSKCGKNVMTNDISEYNFCHGCGADMRGGEQSEQV